VTRNVFQTALVALIVLSASIPSFGGPPLICHPFHIGGAESISWGEGPFDPPADADRDELVETVLSHLKPETSVLARMETLRRATIWCNRSTHREQELLLKLMGRALDAEISDEQSAMAWFDAGFFAQSLDQNGANFVEGIGVERGVIGYAWVRRAIELQPHDPQMHFAAALVTAIHDRDASEKHMRLATEIPADDPLLPKNIRAFKSELGKHLEHHRQNYARIHGS